MTNITFPLPLISEWVSLQGRLRKSLYLAGPGMQTEHVFFELNDDEVWGAACRITGRRPISPLLVVAPMPNDGSRLVDRLSVPGREAIGCLRVFPAVHRQLRDFLEPYQRVMRNLWCPADLRVEQRYGA